MPHAIREGDTLPDSRSFPMSLAAVQQAGARGIELWAVDAAGSLWTVYQLTPGGSWSGWESPGFKGQPAPAARATAALRSDGNVQLFMLDWSGLVWTVAQYAAGGDWGAWQGPAFNGQPVGLTEITASASGEGIQLWALDVNGAVWTTYQVSPGSGWASWQQFGGTSVPFRRLAAAGQNNGGAILFALDASDQVWSIAQTASAASWGSWQGPGIGGQAFDLLEITAAQQSGGRGVELWGIGPEGNVWTLWQTTPGGPWSPWEGPGFRGQAVPARALAAADQNTGNVMLVSLNADNSLSTIAQYAQGGEWGGWSPLAGFSGTMLSRQDQLLKSLAGYFPFDGSPEDPLAPALSATLVGATEWVAAWDARDALQPADTTGGCMFPALSMSPAATGAAVAFWFKPGAASGAEPLLYADEFGIGVMLTSATTLAFSLVSNPIPGATAGPLAEGEWNHVAVSMQSLGASGYVLNAWVNGTRSASVIGAMTVVASQMFAKHQIAWGEYSTAGIGFSGFTMFNAPIGDDAALYLASDNFHPEATRAAEIEYLGARLDGASSISCPDGSGLALAGGYTVTTWLYAELLTYRIFPYSTTEQELFAASDRCRFFFDAQGRLSAWYATPSGPAQLSVDASDLYLTRYDWLHLGFSYDPNAGPKLYVNGELVTTGQIVAAEAWEPASPVSIGSGVQQGMYGLTVYGEALNAAGIAEDLGLDVPTEGLPANAIVAYDLSAVPPVALSADTGLAGILTAPASMVYDVYSAGVALVAGGYVDCGYDADALIPSGQSFTIDAWVYPLGHGGTETVVSRLQGGRGYRVFLQDGMLAAELHGTQSWQSLLAMSTVALAAEEWSRVGVVFTNEVGNEMSITLFLNGRQLANVTAAVPSGSADPPIADPETRLLVGARWDDAVVAASDVFNGAVQRLRFYDAAVAFDQIFSGPDWTPGDPVSDWFLGDDFPRDLTDDEPATLMAGATTTTLVWSADPAGVQSLARRRTDRATAFREGLFSNEHFPDRWAEVPAEHQQILLTTHETAGQVVAVALGDATYLVVHGEVGGTPGVFHIGDADDPTADWATFVVALISLGFGVWGLYAGSSEKLTKTALSMWKNPAVRQAIIAVTEITESNQIASVFVALLRETYASGIISRLLSCYSLSFFSIVRFAAMFAPWAGWALILIDLGVIATTGWDLIQNIRRPQQVRPSAVAAICLKAPDLTGAVPVLMNGDPVTVTVELVPPPQVAVTVGASSGPLLVEPPTLTFPAGSGPQQVLVSSKGIEASAEDGMPVTVTWRGAGVVGEAAVAFRVRVLDLTFDPAEPELQYDAGKDAWVGQFTVQPGPEMTAKSTLEVTLTADSEDGDQLTFDPPTLTFSTLGAAAVGTIPGAQTVQATWSNPGRNVKRNFDATMQAAPPGVAGDGQRRRKRLRKPEQYSAQVAMVDAGRGLSLVVSVNNADGTSQKVVIDGGLTQSYPNLASYLPAGPIDYVVCTHYDDDHIAGLIVLLGNRINDIGRVLFNPPPAAGGTAEAAFPAVREETSAATEYEHNLQSQRQGLAFEQRAGGKLLPVITATPPPGTTIAAAALYRTSWQFAGPSAWHWNGMQSHPRNAQYINRASLLCQFTAQDGAGANAPGLFSLLVTGDGTHKGTMPDVLGFGVLPYPHLHFLQVPHHGSNKNSDLTLYSRVTASHYLISSRWRPHGHPGAEVIRAIVMGNRARGETGYSIWISDPDFKKAGGVDGDLTPDYDGFFPRLTVPGEYNVYLRSQPAGRTANGLAFGVADGTVTLPPATEWVPLDIALR